MATDLCISSQFDDIGLLVQDLLSQIKRASADSLGFLLCDAQLDCGEVTAALQRQVDFQVIGGSTLTFPIIDEKIDEISASLLIISKRDMDFSISCSEPLDPSKIEEQIEDTFVRCVAGMEEKPLLLIPFIPKTSAASGELLIGELFRLAGDLPVFGGIATSDFISTHASVFANGEAYTDRIVLTALGGDIKPVFAVGLAVTNMADYTPTVTKSRDCTVYSVDDMTFCEYMKTLGIATGKGGSDEESLLQYGSLPLQLFLQDRPDDGIPEICSVNSVSTEDGFAVLSHSAPPGTRVGFGILRREDIKRSTKSCLDELLQQMETGGEDGYVYDTLLCVTCVSRYFTQIGGENAEQILLRDAIPEKVSANGYYAFGEICPTKSRKDGSLINRAFGASIVMCAL